MDELRLEARRHLRALAGKADAEFHQGQLEAIRALVEQRSRVLVVQRTGWGKSAVYFIATKMLRDRGEGPSLLISPLLALMDNQVDAARRMGVRAASLNSSNSDSWYNTLDRLQNDEVDLLLVSEQRLNSVRFQREELPKLAGGVGMFIVDEVHCISDWGHDFRPQYRRICRFLDRLPSNIPVIGCTATANDRVIADVEAQLGEGITIVRGPLARKGLRLEAHTDKAEPSDRIAWLVEHLPHLPGTGVIYCLTRRDANLVAEILDEHGITCATYMGGGDDGAITMKQETLERFQNNDLKCIVATSSLGMGYDKPDVGFVVHFQMPSSIIAYYQQVGRAGRMLDASYGILLSGAEERYIQDYFIDQAFPSPDEVEQILSVLDQADDPLRARHIEGYVNIRSKQLMNFLAQLEVEGAVTEESKGYRRTMLPWRYPHERVRSVNKWRREEQATMGEYLRTHGCRMEFLLRRLDDPTAAPCGICDNCTGYQFGHIPAPNMVNKASDMLSRSYVPVEPRKQWPINFGLPKRIIPPSERAERGWCLAPWGDRTMWCELIREGKQTADRFDDRLVDALAHLVCSHIDLDSIQWLTFVPSQRKPALVPNLARRLARTLELDCVATVSTTGKVKPQKTMQNSAHQVRNVWDAFVVDSWLPGGGCLLVDDIIDSRWTVTIIATRLLQAGAECVTPIALASATGAD